MLARPQSFIAFSFKE